MKFLVELESRNVSSSSMLKAFFYSNIYGTYVLRINNFKVNPNMWFLSRTYGDLVDDLVDDLDVFDYGCFNGGYTVFGDEKSAKNQINNYLKSKGFEIISKDRADKLKIII